MTEQDYRDPAIDAFLASVATRLRGMPAARRAEELRELGQHLDLLVAGAQAQGLTRQAASQVAIERFGRAEHLGRELLAASRQGGEHRSPRYYLTFWLGYGVVVALVNLAILAVIDAPLNLADRLGDRLWTVALPALFTPAVFVLPAWWRQRRTTTASS
ncbi:MAG TPA: hypothetical protein VF755_17890 [Catenuloplanes sp.]